MCGPSLELYVDMYVVTITIIGHAYMYIFIIQKYGMTTLVWAASLGHEQVVDVLLKAGANPDIQDHVCLSSYQ